MVQSCGSCAGVGLSGSLTGDEEGGSSRSFDIGQPVDIPAPVAKGIDGVDATSIGFESFGGSNLVKGLLGRIKTVFSSAGESGIGEITGRLRTPGATVMVSIIMDLDGDGIFSFITDIQTSDSFSFTLPDSTYVNKPIAIVVRSSDGVQVSYPIIVTVIEVDGQLTFVTNITNEGAASGMDIQNTRFSFIDGVITYAGLNGNEPRIGRISASGVTSTDNLSMTPSPSISLVQLTPLSATLTAGVSSDSGQIYTISVSNSAATLSTLGDATSLETGRIIHPSEDGTWIATSDVVNSSKKVTLIHVATNTEHQLQVSDASAVSEISYEWMTDNKLMVMQHRPADVTNPYKAYSYDVTKIIEGTGTDVTVTPEAETSYETRNPITYPYNGGAIIFYEKERGNGFYGLFYDTGDREEQTLVIGSYDVTHARYSPESDCIVFETDSSPASETDNMIGIVDPGTGDTRLLTKGMRPEINSDGSSVTIAYLSVDFKGEYQISILHLDEACSPVDTEDEGGSGSVDSGPSVIDTTPDDGSAGYDPRSPIMAQFSENINTDGADYLNPIFTVINDDGNHQHTDFGAFSQDTIISGDGNLCFYENYTATISGDVEDLVGNTMDTDYIWNFITGDGSWDPDDRDDVYVSRSDDVSDPKIAIGNAGYGVVAWLSDNGGGIDDVVGHAINNTVNASSSSLTFDSSGTTATNLKVAANDEDDAIVAWIQDGRAYVKVVTDMSTSPTWGATTSISDIGATVTEVAVDIDDVGNAVAVWNSDHDADTNYDVKYATYSNGSWGATSFVESDVGSATVTSYVNVKYTGAGDFIVAWRQFVGLPVHNARARIYDGGVAGAITTFDNGGEAGAVTGIDLASGRNGKAVIGFTKLKQADGNYYARTYIYDGSAWSSTFFDRHISTNNDLTAKVDMNSRGDAIIVVQSDTGNELEAYVLLFNETPAFRGTTVLKHASNTAVRTSTVGMDGQGNVLALWADNGDGKVWYNRYTYNNVTWSGATALAGGDSAASSPNISVTLCGQAALTYDDLNAGIDSIPYIPFE